MQVLPSYFWMRLKICLNSFPGLMVFIHGFSGQAPASTSNVVQSMPSSANDVKSVDDDYDDSGSCRHCGRHGKRRKGISCATLLFLLAIDAFTIALLLILFYNLKYIAGD